MDRRQKRRAVIVVGSSALLVVLAMSVLWFRCGFRGCPDVNLLKGYMPEQASVMLDKNGNEIAKLFVTRRVVVPVDSMPEHLLNAFVAIEDKRFWDHGGVDWKRVFGAAASNVKSGDISEGSSTITMQLARNVFPDKLPANRKTLWRKMGEARVARQIEGQYSKREIIELYLNQIYFGSGAHGVQAAAEEYYGKGAAQLTLAEAALLAALPRAPSRMNPRANRDAALEGRELVLRRMAQQGMITEEERAKAADAKLVLKERRTKTTNDAPYFVDAVRRLLEDELGADIYTEGYTVHTTLDLDVQRIAEQELGKQLRAVESGTYGSFPHPTYASVRDDTAQSTAEGTPYLQGAVVVLDARSGDVRALVGGRDYEDSEFNRALQAKRQPGSAFKPVVYTAALSAGYTPAHRIVDQPLRYVLDTGRVWEPQNYDGRFAGPVTLRQALYQSRNVPTVRLGNEVGMSRVIGMAEQLGFGQIQAHPSVVLGTAEVTPLQLTLAYATFATLGSRPAARLVARVVARDGSVVWSQEPHAERVLDPAIAFLTTSILQDVVDRGTGTAVRAVGFRQPAAGKTGTTQDAADVWFVGFTPELVATIWMGLDRRVRITRSGTGGEIAAPVWGRIMQRIGARSGGWTPPSGIDERTVDEYGALVAEGCAPQGTVRKEYFMRGTAPVSGCYPSAYAYADSFAWDTSYAEMRDSVRDAARAAEDAGWWDRLKQRFARDDSIANPPVRVPPVGDPLPGQVVIPGTTPPGTPPTTTLPTTTPLPGQPPATARPQRDTTKPKPKLLGKPVDSIRPRPDTTALRSW